MENRRKNFSENETKAFLLCLENFKDILENKKTDAVTNKEKKSAWLRVTAQFNSFPGVHKRSPQQLITYYKNLKRRSNKNRSIEISKTESGLEKCFRQNPLEERLVSIGSVKVPLINQSDSDSEYHKLTSADTAHAKTPYNQKEPYVLAEVIYSESANNIDCLNYTDISIENNSDDDNLSSYQENSSVDMPASNQTIKREPDTFSNKEVTNPEEYEPVPGSALNKDLSCTNSSVENFSVAQHKIKIFSEQHNMEKEKLEMEKKKFRMHQEKHAVEIQLLNEQIKMYKLINEKLVKGEMQLCLCNK